MIDVAITNLTSRVVLAFVLALVAATFGTSLRLPEPVTTLLSTYLLLAIGIKGGAALRASSLGELWAPALATLVLGVVTPLVASLRHVGSVASMYLTRQDWQPTTARCRWSPSPP